MSAHQISKISKELMIDNWKLDLTNDSIQAFSWLGDYVSGQAIELPVIKAEFTSHDYVHVGSVINLTLANDSIKVKMRSLITSKSGNKYTCVSIGEFFTDFVNETSKATVISYPIIEKQGKCLSVDQFE